MAQPFSLRLPLVEGSGNFGSLDGDPAAAMRYTECRLARPADEMLAEIEQRTVHFRPTFDGTKSEPVVLPSKIPNLLVNGATGIAVGMATNIPPHNLDEVMTALVKMLDAQLQDRELSTRQLCRWIKGPDFPTGGQILNDADELKQIYERGGGTIRMRATVESGETKRGSKSLYITSIPYMVNKSQLVARIADVVLSRKMPLLLDVKDVSTDDVRIELSLKAEADEQKVLAYLYKNTPLQSNFSVNLTCLVPTENPEVCRPERLELSEVLWHFLALPDGRRRPSARERARAPPQAHPHPRGLRDRLRRARSDPEDRPGLRRQTGRGQEDHGEVPARRRADGRDPRAEALPAREARDPRRAQGARRAARPGSGDSSVC